MGKIKRERQKFHIAATGDDVAMDDKPIPTLVKTPNATLMPASDNIFAGIDIKLDAINKFADPEPVPKEQPAADKSTKSVPYKKSKSDIIPVAKQPSIAPQRQLTKKEKQKLKHEKLLQKIDVIQQAKQSVKDKRNKKKPSKPDTPVAPISATAELKTLNAKFPAAASTLPKSATPTSAPPKSTVATVNKKKFSTSLKTLEDALLSLNDSLPSLDSVLKLKSTEAKTGLDTDEVDGSGKKGKKGKKGQKFSKGKVNSNANNNRVNKSKELNKQFAHYQKLLNDETYKSNPRAVIALHIKNKMRERR